MERKVLIVIPAYNEADNILNTVRGVVEHGYDYIVVNDGSRDATLDVCRSNGLNVLDLPMNLGIGSAVQAGHKYAQRFGYDIDIQLDGDGQHDPAYLDALVREVASGADLVIGSRFLEKTDRFQSTFMRRVGITWLSAMLELCTGRRVSNPTSGFRACGCRAIDLCLRQLSRGLSRGPNQSRLPSRAGYPSKRFPLRCASVKAAPRPSVGCRACTTCSRFRWQS